MWHLHCIKLHLITSGNGQPASPKIIPKYPCTNTSIRSASCSFCLKSVVSTASAETSAAALKPTPVATSAARFSQTLVDMRPPREGRKLSNVAVQFQKNVPPWTDGNSMGRSTWTIGALCMLVIMKESLEKLKRDTVLFYTFPAQPVLPTRAAQLFHFSG